MKNAFVTIYKKFGNNLEIYNGFSFVNHLIEGDHFFINDQFKKEDLGNLQDNLSKYDRIFCSIPFSDVIPIISSISDSRWMFGGRLLSFLPLENVYNGLFENYLKVPISETFSPYWNDLIIKEKPNHIRYSAMCGVNCYWKKCKFCFAYLYNDSITKRDIGKVYYQLPNYPFLSTVNMYSGSIPPHTLKSLINSMSIIRKTANIWIHARGDSMIKKAISESNNMSNIMLRFGLETLSQKASDKLNKGCLVKTTLEAAKDAVDRGANVSLLIMSHLPFIDDQIIEESLENIDWIKRNIKPTSSVISNGLFFFDNEQIKWPSEKVASEFGDYIVRDATNNDNWRFEKVVISKMSDDNIQKCNSIIHEIKKAGFSVKKEFYNQDRVGEYK